MHDFDRTQVGFGSGAESYEYEFDSPEIGEQEAMELVSELLEVGNEQEFENFLVDLISRATSAVKNFAGSSVGKALVQKLKGVLPQAAQAVGGFLGGSTGSQIGPKIGQAAGNLFEAENFEEENEEQEWEAASSFVKLAHEAAKIASQAPSNSNPTQVAHQALVEAAQIHAPHLVEALTANGGAHAGMQQGAGHMSKGSRTGRWVRHHNRIVLLGI